MIDFSIFKHEHVVLQKYKGREMMVERKIGVIRTLMENAKRRGHKAGECVHKRRLRFWTKVQKILINSECEKVIFT